MTHQFEREGKYWFSSGTHYVGRLSQQDDLGAIMHFVTCGVPWGRLPEHFNVFCFQEDTATFPQPSNPKDWVEVLVKEFPKEEKVRIGDCLLLLGLCFINDLPFFFIPAQAIQQFFKEVDAVTKWHKTKFFANSLGPPLR